MAGPSSDLRQIKQAYAARLKQVHPEDDPDGFQRLRAAYETAQRLAQHQAVRREPPAAPPQATPAAEAPPPSPAPPSSSSSEELPYLAAPPPPGAAAQGLFTQLLQLPAPQRPGAISLALRQPGWESLDYQAALEQAIAACLGADFDRLFALIEPFAAHYDWSDNRISRQHNPAFATLWVRYQARDRRLTLEQGGLRHDPPRHRALLLLLAPPDQAAFRRFARREKNLEAMQALLDHFQRDAPALLRYEVNAASAQWWRELLDRRPLSWDRIAGLIGLGIFAGPIIWLVISGILDGSGLFDSTRHRHFNQVMIVLSMAAPAAINAAWRAWLRRGALMHVLGLRNRWRHEPRRRRIAIAVTVLVLALCLGAGAVPGLWIAQLLVPALLVFWSSWRVALGSFLVFGWLLQVPLSLAVDAALPHLPWLQARLDSSVTMIWFPHNIAAALTPAFAAHCVAAYRRLRRREPSNPGGLVFSSALAVCLLSLFAGGMLGLLDSATPTPAVRPTSAIRPRPLLPAPNLGTTTLPLARPPDSGATSLPGLQLRGYGTTTLPTVRPPDYGLKTPTLQLPGYGMTAPPAALLPAHRTQQDIHETYQQYRKGFEKILQTWFSAHPIRKAGWLALSMNVAADGGVSSCHVTESTYQATGLERQLEAYACTQKFGAVSGSPETITYSWGKRPKPASP